MAILQAVIFDHSTIFVREANLQEEVRNLLTTLKEVGLKIGVFASDPADINNQLSTLKYPSIDLYQTRQDVGGQNKGRPIWMDAAARTLRIDKSQILYVGDEQRDYNTAANAPTYYIQACWGANSLKSGATALSARQPRTILLLASHFMMQPPRWAFSLDSPTHGLYIRSLLDANTSLAATNPASFTPQHLLRDKKPVQVRGNDAAKLLGLHALSSLNSEGLVDKDSFYTCYPSSTPNNINPVLSKAVEAISKLLHGYPRLDALVRAVQAIDTSNERKIAKMQGRSPNISFLDQANSVHVNPKYKDGLKDRTVIVFDDFTNTGTSLDWARNLLVAAGAAKVVLISIGKFRYSHDIYMPASQNVITPFIRKDYQLDNFNTMTQSMDVDSNATSILQHSFENLRDGKPY